MTSAVAANPPLVPSDDEEIPTIYLYDDKIGQVQLVEVGGADSSIVRAARVSYGKDRRAFDPIKDAKLIEYLITNHHGSPIEHNMLTYRCTVPLFVVQEMLRHRIGVSVNQESARYTEIMPRAYIPAVMRTQSTTNKQGSGGILEGVAGDEARQWYEQSVSEAYRTYHDLLEIGVAREVARGVLPHCTYTSLYYTMNLRSLFHFCDLRLDKRAQWEIRQVARAFVELAEAYFPVTLGIYAKMKAWDDWTDG